MLKWGPMRRTGRHEVEDQAGSLLLLLLLILCSYIYVAAADFM